MKKDQIFLKGSRYAGDFEFNAEVAEAFDDMIIRSVPFYLEQQNMIKEIAKKFWIPGTDIYDLGCSTATTLINMCREIKGATHFTGYDNSIPMLERAKQKIRENGFEDRITVRNCDLNKDLSKILLKNASIVTLCWTLQFINPTKRDNLIRWIYNGLIEDGVLIVTEKVLTNNTHMSELFNDFYYDFKRKNDYSEKEIQRKRKALENVLIPYSIDENIDMIRRNGFESIEFFFQWYNFIGILCVKKN